MKVADLARVGELIESADQENLVPDLSRETPDLMQLFGAAKQAKSERPLPDVPKKDAKPPKLALFQSARERKAGVESVSA